MIMLMNIRLVFALTLVALCFAQETSAAGTLQYLAPAHSAMLQERAIPAGRSVGIVKNSLSQNQHSKRWEDSVKKINSLLSVASLDSSGQQSKQRVEERSGPMYELLVQTLSHLLEGKMKSSEEYTTLIGRYQCWFMMYSRVSLIKLMNSATDLVEQTLTNLMDVLSDENESNESANQEPKDRLFAVLEKLVGHLETKLEDEHQVKCTLEKKSEEFQDELERVDAKFKEAAGRAMVMIYKQASNAFKSNFGRATSMALIDSLALYLAHNQMDNLDHMGRDGTALTMVVPVVAFMGRASKPLIVNYLRNATTRASAMLLSNPMVRSAKEALDEYETNWK